MRRRSSGKKESLVARRKSDEKRFVKAVLRRLDHDLAAGRLTGPAGLHERVMIAIGESTTLSLARYPYRIDDLVKSVMALVIQRSVEMLVESATEHAGPQLAKETTRRRGFEQRLHNRWGPALDTLTLFRLLCLESGMALHERKKPAKDDWTYAALIRLHARACLITAEVLSLLRAGFASGAHARWRTAHEIAVVGFFVAQHGQATAERYLLHDAIENRRATVDYQQYAARLGYEPYSQEELIAIQAKADGLVARFGKAYAEPYGWASEALSNPYPKFRDIEAASSIDHMRPYYRMASHPTHAGTKGIAFDIGLRDSNLMLAGSSDAGLTDPGHAIAISLMQITVSLLNLERDMGNIVIMTLLQRWCDVIGDAFMLANRKQLDDHEQIS